MAELIHAQELLKLVNERDCTVDELNVKFGENAKFTNCGNMEFSLNELLDFLVGKKKILINSNIVSFNRDVSMCSCN